MLLRPPIATDAVPLLAILGEPEASIWWTGYTADRVREEFLESDHSLVIEIDGRTADAILLFEDADPEFRKTVIHLFLGAAWYGKRYGAEALVVAISWLADQGHHRFTLDPNVHNATVLAGDHL